MGSITFNVILFVSLVQFQVILCKPFLFDLLCDYVCDDDDNSTTTNTSDDYFGFNDICACGTQAPPTTKRGNAPSVDLNLPGVSLQMSNTNGQWSLSVSANPSTPANSVVPLPAPNGASPVIPGPQVPGSPQLPGGPGGAPLPGGPPGPGVSGGPPGPTTVAATPAAAATAAPAPAPAA